MMRLPDASISTQASPICFVPLWMQTRMLLCPFERVRSADTG
jgi:hypothetical protein